MVISHYTVNIYHYIFITACYVLVLRCFFKDSSIHRTPMCVRVIIMMRDAQNNALATHSGSRSDSEAL